MIVESNLHNERANILRLWYTLVKCVVWMCCFSAVEPREPTLGMWVCFVRHGKGPALH